MTKNGLDIQTISTKRTDTQADRVLLLGQVTEKKEKAHPSHFLKFLFASRTNGSFGFALHTSRPFAKPKECNVCERTLDSMKDWKQILYDIYAPEVGSIWAAPNGIWTNSFASNKSETNYHPSVVGKVSSCRTSCQIVPGTSKDYRKGSCVFKVKLNTTDPACPLSYFLIDLWMTFSKSDLLTLKQGWNGIENLNGVQVKAFKLQIKFCKGIDV